MVLLRTTVEAYLLLDPSAGSPRERWRALLHLHAAAERDAWRRGLKTTRLAAAGAQYPGSASSGLGGVRDDSWKPYCRIIAHGLATF